MRKSVNDLNFKSYIDAMAAICEGDTVRLYDDSFVVARLTRGRSTDLNPSPEFCRVTDDGDLNNVYSEEIEWRDGSFTLIKQANKREFKKLMNEGTIRMGNTIRINDAYRPSHYGANRSNDHDAISPGQYGEVTGVDAAGKITCKVDSAYNAVEILEDHLEVIDWDCESIHRRAQREAGFKYEKDHVHSWTLKWEETYRECPCGATQWKLDCWTGYSWRSKTPRAILVERPDLKRPESFIEPVPFTEFTPPFRRRFQDILPNRVLNQSIELVGLGGIGSFVALSLVKMGFTSVRMYDFDIVSEENMGTQLFGRHHVGCYKASAMAEILGALSHTDATIPTARNSAFCRDFCRPGSRIVISCVDSMKARTDVYKVAHWAGMGYLIDARMGAENALMYVTNLHSRLDRASYEKTLYSDSEADQEVCTAKATVYTGSMLAGHIVKAVKDVLVGNQNYARITHWNIADNTVKCHTIAEAKQRWADLEEKRRVKEQAERVRRNEDALRWTMDIRPHPDWAPALEHAADSLRYSTATVALDEPPIIEF
jgi:molybdopterin/thiamine biosynthesis adenylyltransferase